MPAGNSISHPGTLLGLWEQAQRSSQAQRADKLLHLYLGKDWESSDLSIEWREHYLLEIRRILFGRSFESLATCPSCGEKIEWQMNCSDFLEDHLDRPYQDNFTMVDSDYEIQYRLPRPDDIVTEEKREILECCVLSVRKNNLETSLDDMPSELWVALENQIENNSPVSSTLIRLSCPECTHNWSLSFDVLSFLWVEIDQWARKFLEDVCQLARAFGWAESDIVNMSHFRRQYYLRLLNS